jgi:hypothetical protein
MSLTQVEDERVSAFTERVERHEKTLLVGMCILYLLARLPMMKLSLWLDEGTSFWLARAPIDQLLALHTEIKATHAVGYFYFLNIWCRCFGFSEISMRLPSLVIGIPGGYFTYLLARKMKGTLYAMGVLLFYVFSLALISFQTCARMYSFFYAFTIMGLYFLYSAHENRDKEKFYLTLWGLVNGLNMNFHYFGVFVLAGQLILWLFLTHGEIKRIKILLLYLLIPILLIIPFVTIALTKIDLWKIFHPGGNPAPAGSEAQQNNIALNCIYSVVFLFTGEQPSGLPPVAFYSIFTILLIGSLYACRAMEKKDFLFILFFIVLMILEIYAGDWLSFKTGYLMQYYYFAFMAPLFFMLFFATLLKMPRALLFLFFCAFLIVNILGVYRYSTDSTIGYGNWRDAVSYIDAHRDKDDIVFIDPTMAIPLYMFYTRTPSSLHNDREFYEKNIPALRSKYKRIWYLFLPGYSTAQQRDLFYNRNLRVLDIHKTMNVRKEWFMVSILYTLE